jgi:L-lactate dehydrogenase complex protein LldG
MRPFLFLGSIANCLNLRYSRFITEGKYFMSSRNQILGKLRQAQKPFTDIEQPKERQHAIRVSDTSPDALKKRFIEEAEKLGCFVYPVEDEQEALQKLMGLIEDEKQVLAWDDAHVPIASLSNILSDKEIAIVAHDDSAALLGITGVDAALAATGSLILRSGTGKYRTTSLLPDKHIAILRSQQIIPDLETWVQQEQVTGFGAFKESSNTTIVSGPSKTADIGQTLIKGAHGPRQVHIILIDG